MEAATAIRERNKSTEILIFSDEPYPFYSRIHLSSFLGEDTPEESIFIRNHDWFRENRIRLLAGTRIVGVLPRQNAVRDASGKIHHYDRLLIAGGAQPFVPPIERIDKRGVFVLRDLQQALDIRKYAQKCRAAVVLGGGILGIEAASSLQKRGLVVSVVEMEDHIMSPQLDRAGAGVLQNILEKRGISFFLKQKAVKFAGEDSIEAVQLESGEGIPAELVLISTGIVPNVRLAREAGIEVNRGIVVNRNLQTSYPNIYAAGDAAEFEGKIFGIWPAAVEQGRVAGTNISGVATEYSGTLPLHILKVADIDLTSLGQKYREKPGEREIVHIAEAAGKYVKLVHDGEYLLGAIVLGTTGVGFRLERIIKNGKSIREMLSEFENGNWDILKKKKK